MAPPDLRTARTRFGAAPDVPEWAECGVEGVQATGRQRQQASPMLRSSQQRRPVLSSCCLTIWLRDRRRKNLRQETDFAQGRVAAHTDAQTYNQAVMRR